MSFQIHTANLEQINLITDWARQEGWNPGINDAALFRLADPTGFFIGLIDDKPITAISNVKYSDQFSFLGLYIVKPEYRGQGFGYKIWQHAINYVGDTNCGLDGVVAEQSNYMKSGFNLAYRNIRYVLSTSTDLNITTDKIVAASRVDINKIFEYDRLFFPTSRNCFLQSWMLSNNARSLVYVDNNHVLGYGVIRECAEGYKIGPLFADSREIAEHLFLKLNSLAKPKNKIYLDIPEPNTQAKQMVESLGMAPVFETARMYNKFTPEISIDRTYGITTFEIG